MIGIIFYMEDSKESMFSDALVWRRLTIAFNVDSYCIVDKTEKKVWKGYSDTLRQAKVVDSVEEALKMYATATPVIVSKSGDTDLKTFKHPKNAVYIFGPDSGPPDPVKGVRINLPVQLWAIQAASIVLFHRSLDGINSSS